MTGPGSDRPIAGRRRLLVVAYYFPPMGMSGVQRVAKLVKYLPEFGWTATVLTVHPRGYFAFDPDLLTEVEDAGCRIVRTGSFDPTRAFGRSHAVALPAESGRRILSAVSQSIFVPDNKIGWYPAAVRKGKSLFAETSFDAVLSSAPPYTAHLVAARLAHLHDVPLVTDFRDDWLENPRHRYPTGLHRALHALLERRVIRRSAKVISINSVMSAALRRRHPEAPEGTFRVIPQGFDPDDYPDTLTPAASGALPRPFRLVYTGVFYDAQTPGPFLEGLAAFRSARPGAPISASFFGLFPDSERERISRLGLGDIVTVGPYLTHRQAMMEVLVADVPWLTVGRCEGSEQISTGKLYAYVGARKPILALVPDGAARDALALYGAAEFADPDRPDDIARAIGALYDAWRQNRLPTPSPGFVEGHDRRRLAGDVANLLDALVRA